MAKLLDSIDSPEELKQLSKDQLPILAEEIRTYLIDTVTKTGGHLGASLGVVELTIALHYVLDSPKDKICWDVGHQAYVHKILTGRRVALQTNRQYKGLSGFPNPDESPHDFFSVGHAGTAISQALGLAVARDLFGTREHIVAVVGDGGLTAGLSYEGLNNAGHIKRPFLVILNDNKMSIAKNVGAISKYLNRIITAPLYNRLRHEVEEQLDRVPRIKRLFRRSEESLKNIFVPGIIFEELGFRYFGPLDGHDVKNIVVTLKNVTKLKGPVLLHVITEKGKGYLPAATDPCRGHAVKPAKSMIPEKIEDKKSDRLLKPKKNVSYTEIFSRSIIKLARHDPRVVAITAAMPDGTGLIEFQKEFPDRFFDVGIAEQHAVTFSGALAKGGLKPVVAIYSTFMQRALDQVIHDVAMQRLNVVFCLDRAGHVGSDGASHQGLFDLSFLGPIPGAVLAGVKDEAEMDRMLELAITHNGPVFIRYPRGTCAFEESKERCKFKIGEGELEEEGEAVAILATGHTVELALEVAAKLKAQGFNPAVANMRFIKPLDTLLVKRLAESCRLLVTLEEHILSGGFGSQVLSYVNREGLRHITVKNFGLPEKFFEHGPPLQILAQHGFDSETIARSVVEELEPSRPVSTPHF